MKILKVFSTLTILIILFCSCNLKDTIKTFEFPFTSAKMVISFPKEWFYIVDNNSDENNVLAFGPREEVFDGGDYYGMVSVSTAENVKDVDELIKTFFSGTTLSQYNIEKILTNARFIAPVNETDMFISIIYYPESKHYVMCRFNQTVDADTVKDISKSIFVTKYISKQTENIIASFPDDYNEIKPEFVIASTEETIEYQIIPKQWKNKKYDDLMPAAEILKDKDSVFINHGERISFEFNGYEPDSVVTASYIYHAGYENWFQPLIFDGNVFIVDVPNDQYIDKPILVEISCHFQYTGTIKYIIKFEFNN